MGNEVKLIIAILCVHFVNPRPRITGKSIRWYGLGSTTTSRNPIRYDGNLRSRDK